MTVPVISGKQLVKTVGDKMILRGVDIDIAAGEAVTILGPNGAGKSTLLKIFSTLLKPSSGELFIAGRSVNEESSEIKRKIGFLPHNSLLYDHLTAKQNLVFYGKLYRVADLDKRIDYLLKVVGLYHFRNEPVRSFSRGMIQRLSIARAVIHRPQLLLLDEPHTGLDVEATRLLNRMILELKADGCTIVMVTHDFEQALLVSERIVILRRGKLTDSMETTELGTANLQKLYEEQVVGY